MSIIHGPYKTRHYTKYGTQCHQLLLSCSILTVNHGVVSPTRNIKPTLFVTPRIYLEELWLT